MKNIITTFLFAACLVFISCGSDNGADCTETQFTSDINAAINQFTAAFNAYTNDPTNSSLCNALEDAANNWLDAIEQFNGCEVIAQSDYDQQIQSARDQFNSLPGC